VLLILAATVSVDCTRDHGSDVNSDATGSSSNNGTDASEDTQSTGANPCETGDSGSVVWMFNLASVSKSRAEGIAVAPTGGVYVGGVVHDVETSDPGAWLGRVDADGSLAWEHRRDGPVLGQDNLRDVASDAIGNVFVTGELRVGEEDTDFWASGRDQDGALLWEDLRPGPMVGYDSGDSITFAADTVVVLGHEQIESTPGSSPFLRAYAPDGSLLWTRPLAHAYDTPSGIASLASGDVVMTGEGYDDATGGVDVFLRAYDVGDGAELWSTLFDPSGGFDDAGIGVVEASDGSLYVAGSAGTSRTADALVSRHDGVGAPLWWDTAGAGGVAADYAIGVATTPDGGVVATGTRYDTVGNESDIWVRRFDPEGNELWSWVYVEPGEDFADDAADVVVDANGSLFVSGTIGRQLSPTRLTDLWVARLCL